MKLSPVSRMQHLSAPLVIFGILSCATAAFAAHPLITDDAGTMGTGKSQLELTGEYGYDKEDGVITKTRQGDASFTYGLSEAADLVVGLPYLHVKTSDETSTMTENGFSDISLAVKWRLYEDNGLSLAIKPGLTLPTGDDEEGLGAGKATYSFFFVTSKEMDPWGFHLNLGYVRNENTLDEERDLWHASIASTVALTENLVAVANLGVESNSDKLAGTDPAFFLVGLVYALSEELDLDCGIKYGLNDPETDSTVLAGLTWKF